jgi:hypothetical protein
MTAGKHVAPELDVYKSAVEGSLGYLAAHGNLSPGLRNYGRHVTDTYEATQDRAIRAGLFARGIELVS